MQAGLFQSQSQIGIQRKLKCLVPREPPHARGFPFRSRNRNSHVAHDQITQVVMCVSRLATACRNAVHIQIERPGRIRRQFESGQACFFGSLTKRTFSRTGIARFQMPARLNPYPQFHMMKKNRPASAAINDKRARRDMARNICIS